MYTVVKDFTDLQDKNHVYHAGDEFPRKGIEVSDARLLELSTTENKRGEILIELVQPEKPQKEAEEILEEAEEVPQEPEAQPVEEKPKKAKKKK